MSSKLGLIILCLLVVVSPAIFSQGDHAVFAQQVPPDTEGTGEGVKTIHSISVQKGSDSLTVDVQADGTCAFKQYEFKNPSRLVVDIYGAINRTKRSTIPVDYMAVRSVRIGQFKPKDPMITRVVLDLDEQPWPANAFQVKSEEGVIRIALGDAHTSNATLAARRTPTAHVPDKAKSSAPVDEVVLASNNIAATVAHTSEDRADQQPAKEPLLDVRVPTTVAAAFPIKTPEETDADTKSTPVTTPVILAAVIPVTSSEAKDTDVKSAETTAPTALATASTPKPAETTNTEIKSSDQTAPTAPVASATPTAEASTPSSATPNPSLPNAHTWARENPTQVVTGVATHLSAPQSLPLTTEERASEKALAPISATASASEPKTEAVTPETTAKVTNLELKSPAPTSSLSVKPELGDTPPPTAAAERAMLAPTGSAKDSAANAMVKLPPVVATGTQVTTAVPTPVARALTLKPALALANAAPPTKPENEGGAQTAKGPVPEMPRYTGEPISLDFKDGDLVDFFRLLSQITGLNIVLDPSIKGNISIKMTQVPYDQVFDVVLENNDLEKKIQGNVVRVARKETLRKEEEERRKLKEAQMLAADTVTETVRLNYASADALAKTLAKHLSAKGEIVIDQRTNTLIVKDIPEPVLSIKKLIYAVDTAQPQVEIEARIVSASRDFARDIGVQLGFVEGNLQRSTIGGANTFGTIGGTRPSASPGDTTFIGNSPGTGRGQPPGQTTSGGVSVGIGNSTGGNYIVNLPAQPPNRLFGVGYSLGNIFDKFLLDTSITAGEQRGLAKLISQPKVTVQNNTKANITQGLRFPVQVIQNNTVTVQFFDAALKLEVQPQITDAGTVLLEIAVQNNVADFSKQVNGIPSIRTSESKTRVLVGDGGTTVIAGILVDTENRIEQKAPVIANVPIVGNLFKRRFNDRTTQEVLFFITPRIRKEGF